MNIGLALEIDSALESLAGVVTELDDVLKETFRGKDYGSDVANLFIGIVLTEPAPEDLHPVRDLKFRRRVKIPALKLELENVVEYDVKPDFRTFSQLSPPQARRYLAQLLIDSLSIIEKHKKNYPNFDFPRFRADLEAFLGSRPK